VTVPVGTMAEPGSLTTAVRVTIWPTVAGFVSERDVAEPAFTTVRLTVPLEPWVYPPSVSVKTIATVSKPTASPPTPAVPVQVTEVTEPDECARKTVGVMGFEVVTKATGPQTVPLLVVKVIVPWGGGIWPPVYVAVNVAVVPTTILAAALEVSVKGAGDAWITTAPFGDWLGKGAENDPLLLANEV
jgi:hypothetical protein